MSISVLVAYTSKYGSTQQVAEQVSLRLQEHELQVSIQPMHDVSTLEPYDAVVLGTALYMGHWHKETRAFLTKHHAALIPRSLALFALGPLHNEAKEFDEARHSLDNEIAKYQWFAPMSIKIFGGKLDPAHFRFPESIIPGLKNMPAGDIRNWNAIRDWADDIAAQFQAAISPMHQTI